MNNMDNRDDVNIVRIEMFDKDGEMIEDITTRTYDEYHAGVWGSKAVNCVARNKVRSVRVFLDDVYQYEINRYPQDDA